MANRSKAIDLLFELEGFEARLEGDAGGHTLFGIARKFNPAAAVWATYDAAPKPLQTITVGLLRAQAAEFYRIRYWETMQLDDARVPDAVAFELLESAVHFGRCGYVVEFLQRALNILNDRGRRWPELEVDGIVGPDTLSALAGIVRAGVDVVDVVDTFNAYQARALLERVERDEEKERFWRGWLRRVRRPK